jgi:polar amino acid transport system substrate-binding protein
MKKSIVIALILCLLLGLAACSKAPQTDSEAVKASGKLVVGITDFEPMDYQDADGNWIGFDADLAVLFAESLGVKVEFVEIDWDNKVMELDNKSIDCIWNGMTLLPEVTAATSCSNPYMRNAQVVVIAADQADAYASVQDMSDLVFAVEAGSAGEAAAAELGLKTTAVSSQANALLEVNAGTSDAAIIDLLMAYAMVGEGTGYAELTYTFSLNEEQYGVAFRKGSDLTAALNSFFAAKYADGTMDKLADTYNLSGSVIAQ